MVTCPGGPPLATVEDLAGQEVFGRQSSSYHQSLLEMVKAGLLKTTIVDNYLAGLCKQVYTDLTVHDTVAVRTDGKLAVAIRKDSPQLAAAPNG